MTISIDWPNKLVLSDASITDIVAFKDTIRGLEDDAIGMLHDPVIQYKRVDLGGGAYFHDVPFINGYQLKFPTPGNYTVIGNIGSTIVPVAGVFVDRTKAAAFATVAGAGGGSGPTAAEIAAAVRIELSTELARIDTATSTRLATAGYTAPDNVAIADIDAKTDALTLLDVAVSTRNAATPPTAVAIAAATLAAADVTPIASNVKKVNAVALTGTGVSGNEWGPA